MCLEAASVFAISTTALNSCIPLLFYCFNVDEMEETEEFCIRHE